MTDEIYVIAKGVLPLFWSTEHFIARGAEKPPAFCTKGEGWVFDSYFATGFVDRETAEKAIWVLGLEDDPLVRVEERKPWCP